MADKAEDQKQYQGLRGRFRKMNEGRESYFSDMRHEWKEAGGDAQVIFGLVPLLGMFGLMVGSIGGVAIGTGSGIVVDGLIEGSPEADIALMQQESEGNRYQVVRVQGEGTFMLVNQHGNYYAMERGTNGEFVYIDNPATALKIAQDVIERLDVSIADMEAGNLPDQEIVSFLKAQKEISVLHQEGETLERVVDQLETDSSMRVQYLEKLKEVREFWASSAQHMVNVEYGLDDAEIEALPTDVSFGHFLLGGLVAGGLVGLGAGLGTIPADMVMRTNKRRRKRKAKRDNRNKM